MKNWKGVDRVPFHPRTENRVDIARNYGIDQIFIEPSHADMFSLPRVLCHQIAGGRKMLRELLMVNEKELARERNFAASSIKSSEQNFFTENKCGLTVQPPFFFGQGDKKIN